MTEKQESTAPDATSAAQREAEGAETVTVPFRDIAFTFPASADDWPIAATVEAEAGHFALFVKEVLDDEQWTKFTALKPRPTNAEALEFFNEYAKVLGLGSAGE